jgi:hypothetical protein
MRAVQNGLRGSADCQSASANPGHVAKDVLGDFRTRGTPYAGFAHDVLHGLFEVSDAVRRADQPVILRCSTKGKNT